MIDFFNRLFLEIKLIPLRTNVLEIPDTTYCNNNFEAHPRHKYYISLRFVKTREICSNE